VTGQSHTLQDHPAAVFCVIAARGLSGRCAAAAFGV
jgi:hypothetical protein